MRAKLQKIGNSKGIRIPKALLEEVGFETFVELMVEGNRLIISPIRNIRADWEEQYKTSSGDINLLLPEILENEFDREEWTWE